MTGTKTSRTRMVEALRNKNGAEERTMARMATAMRVPSHGDTKLGMA